QLASHFAGQLIMRVSWPEASRAKHRYRRAEFAQPLEATFEFSRDPLEPGLFLLGRTPLGKKSPFAIGGIGIGEIQLVGSKACLLPVPLPGFLPGVDGNWRRLILFFGHGSSP